MMKCVAGARSAQAIRSVLSPSLRFSSSSIPKLSASEAHSYLDQRLKNLEALDLKATSLLPEENMGEVAAKWGAAVGAALRNAAESLPDGFPRDQAGVSGVNEQLFEISKEDPELREKMPGALLLLIRKVFKIEPKVIGPEMMVAITKAAAEEMPNDEVLMDELDKIAQMPGMDFASRRQAAMPALLSAQMRVSLRVSKGAVSGPQGWVSMMVELQNDFGNKDSKLGPVMGQLMEAQQKIFARLNPDEIKVE